ncbi:MAG TPA: virulence factor [Phycisphaerae bacterium]|jgi:hypothetical protein
MATYKVMYWQEIPSQIRAEDSGGEVDLQMPPKFMEYIDKVATERGLGSSDDYIAQWKWSDEEDRDGTAQEVAEAVMAELEAKFKL